MTRRHGLFPTQQIVVPIQQIVVGLLQLCIWKEASFLSSFANPSTNPKQGLHFLSTALIYHSTSPSSCFAIAFFVCFGVCLFLTPILVFSRASPLQGHFLVLGCAGMRNGSGAGASLPMLRLVLPSAAAPLQRDQPPASSPELVQDPRGEPLLSFHTLLPACLIPRAVTLARKTSMVFGARALLCL